MAAHQCDDLFVVANVDRARPHVAFDRRGDMLGALGGHVGDRDFFDVRLFGKIVDGAEAHAAGAQNKDSHAEAHGSECA